jgi:hypothetical protein
VFAQVCQRTANFDFEQPIPMIPIALEGELLQGITSKIVDITSLKLTPTLVLGFNTDAAQWCGNVSASINCSFLIREERVTVAFAVD